MYFKFFRRLIIVFIFIFSYNLLEHKILSEEKNCEKHRVFITAHRGSSLKARDNSIEAINIAIEEKADYIEIDVRRTKDNKLVLSHDDVLLKILVKVLIFLKAILMILIEKEFFL